MNDALQKFDERKPTDTPVIVEPNEFVTVIERLSRMKDIPVDKIEQLFKMKQAEDDRFAKREFNVAFVKVQSNMVVVKAASENEHTKSMYAKLEAISKAITPIYTAEGFALMFHQGYATEKKPLADGHIRMVADVMHNAGHTEIVTGDIPLDDKGTGGKRNKTDTHATGSSFSYGRRYMKCLIFDIPTGDDDDGNAAGGGGSTFVDKKQLKTIGDMIKAKNIDTIQFLGYMGVEATDEIPAKDFSKAMIALKKAKGREREPGSDDE